MALGIYVPFQLGVHPASRKSCLHKWPNDHMWKFPKLDVDQTYPGSLFFICRLVNNDTCLASLMRLMARDDCCIITADRKYTTGNAVT